MSYELVPVAMPADWDCYHSIRRVELFEARGRVGIYDPNHADERHPDHVPLLFKYEGRGIATTRLDFRVGGVAIVRLVAVTRSEQGKVHGRMLAEYTEGFARRRGATRLLVNAADTAIGYYEKLGFAREAWDPSELVGMNATSVQMSKSLE